VAAVAAEGAAVAVAAVVVRVLIIMKC